MAAVVVKEKTILEMLTGALVTIAGVFGLKELAQNAAKKAVAPFIGPLNTENVRAEIVVDFLEMAPNQRNNLDARIKEACRTHTENKLMYLLGQLPKDPQQGRKPELIKLNALTDEEFKLRMEMLNNDTVNQWVHRVVDNEVEGVVEIKLKQFFGHILDTANEVVAKTGKELKPHIVKLVNAIRKLRGQGPLPNSDFMSPFATVIALVPELMGFMANKFVEVFKSVHNAIRIGIVYAIFFPIAMIGFALILPPRSVHLALAIGGLTTLIPLAILATSRSLLSNIVELVEALPISTPLGIGKLVKFGRELIDRVIRITFAEMLLCLFLAVVPIQTNYTLFFLFLLAVCTAFVGWMGNIHKKFVRLIVIFAALMVPFFWPIVNNSIAAAKDLVIDKLPRRTAVREFCATSARAVLDNHNENDLLDFQIHIHEEGCYEYLVTVPDSWEKWSIQPPDRKSDGYFSLWPQDPNHPDLQPTPLLHLRSNDQFGKDHTFYIQAKNLVGTDSIQFVRISKKVPAGK